MKVKIENNYSETQNIPSGIPQGSVLRLFLFLIFINDLPIDIRSEIKLIADDVKLLVRPLFKERKQIDLDKLSYLRRYFEIKLWYKKCEVLHIGSQNIKV